MMIRVGINNYINSKEIVYVGEYDTQPMRRKKKGHEEVNTLIDTTKGKKTNTVIITCDGSMILSVLNTNEIIVDLNKANN